MKQSPSTQNHIPDASKMVPDDTRELARHQPCGCVICYCKNDVRCQGCGAKSCGTHDAGNIPSPVYVVEVDNPTHWMPRPKAPEQKT